MSYINSFMYKLEVEGDRLEDGSNNIYRITLDEWDKEFIFLPRDKVKGFLKKNKDEFENLCGVYFLINKEKKELYIGQGRIKERLIGHLRKKKFWDKVIIFLQNDRGFNKGQTEYWESFCLKILRKKEGWKLRNDKEEGQKNMSETDENILRKEAYPKVNGIFSILGYDFLEEETLEATQKKTQKLFREEKEKVAIYDKDYEISVFCTSRNIFAEGKYVPKDNKLKVLEGSSATINVNKSFRNHFLRDSLIKDKILKKQKNSYIFTKDKEFNSPSVAISIILGSPTSGPERWKVVNGMNLKTAIKNGLTKQNTLFSTKRYFSMNTVGISAKGYVIKDNKFVVLKDSCVRIDVVKSIENKYKKLKQKLIKKGVLSIRGDKSCYAFIMDYKFSSPSAAASVIAGRNINGRKSWKDEKGKFLGK